MEIVELEEKRIVIIGNSGSGKSTLAQRLGRMYRCKVLHIDCVHWLPGWKERDKRGEKAIVASFLNQNKNWVIDGNYREICYGRRLNEATDIIYMSFNRGICLIRVIKRYMENRGKTRKSMTAGCEEKIGLEFIWWVLYKGRDKKHQNNYKAVCKKYPEKITILRNPRDVKRFISNLQNNSNSSAFSKIRGFLTSFSSKI